MGACTEATLAPHAATAAHRQPLTELRRRHRPSPAVTGRLNHAYTTPLSALPGERVAGAFPSLVSVLRAWADSPTPLLPLAKLLSSAAVQVVCAHLLGVAAPSGVRVRSAACASSCECGECRTPNRHRHYPLPASPSRLMHKPTRHSRRTAAARRL